MDTCDVDSCSLYQVPDDGDEAGRPNRHRAGVGEEVRSTLPYEVADEGGGDDQQQPWTLGSPAVAAAFKVLADPARLRLLSMIASADGACACDLVEPLGHSQPTVSHHLSVLTETGLVSRERRGRWAYYRVVPERVAVLWTSEVVATVGLLLVIFGVVRSGRATAAPFAVGAYIGGAYFFTSATSFANPAVTVARTLSDTFAGIVPSSAPAFVVCQFVGLVVAVALILVLYPDVADTSDAVVVPMESEEHHAR
jgi:DNA-binding transcriptional ArsR family regulator